MQQSVETVRAILRALGVENWESFGLYPETPAAPERPASSREPHEPPEPADAPRERPRRRAVRAGRSRAGVG